MTGNPEAISSPVGLVPIKTLVFTVLRADNSEAIPKPDLCDVFSSETRVMRKRCLTVEPKAQKL